MSLDGSSFVVYKFRSMYHEAEASTGPGLGRRRGPAVHAARPVPPALRHRRTPAAVERPAGATCRSSGPRPERPYFVDQFKHRYPQYMLRHKVKSGITGWAQVNGWRGNTSLEKRIEFDLYYIENWSLSLDVKIMWLTLVRGLGLYRQSPAQ